MRLWKNWWVHLLLLAGAVIMLLPFYWMIITAVKPYEETLKFPPTWWTWPFHFENFPGVLRTQALWGRYFLNSAIVTTITTVGEVTLSIFAAYAFARLQFFGKNILFTLFLATMMVPMEVLLVPNYITLTDLGLVNTYGALIIPWLVSVFAIFLLRQHFLSIPKELEEAAKLDGCGHIRFLWQIMVPLSKPAIATIALFKFIGSWNDFLWTLIMTNTPEMRTAPVGLKALMQDEGLQYHLWMAGAVMVMLPVLILFLFAQKQFIEGIARSGLKG
jgi:multiple sugar transport system permease protein